MKENRPVLMPSLKRKYVAIVNVQVVVSIRTESLRQGLCGLVPTIIISLGAIKLYMIGLCRLNPQPEVLTRE